MKIKDLSQIKINTNITVRQEIKNLLKLTNVLKLK